MKGRGTRERGAVYNSIMTHVYYVGQRRIEGKRQGKSEGETGELGKKGEKQGIKHHHSHH